jgi:nucleotide-binding universal stress UspA family protein
MKIMAALDKSEYAFNALRKAVEISIMEHSELTIFSVYHDFVDVEGLSMGIRESLSQQTEETVAQGKAFAEKSVVFVKTAIEAGYSPADNIVNYAERNNVDMIVMGHKSKTGLERLLVGSVAAKVVTYAPCSVLVVR